MSDDRNDRDDRDDSHFSTPAPMFTNVHILRTPSPPDL